jgi:hypothetical protein
MVPRSDCFGGASTLRRLYSREARTAVPMSATVSIRARMEADMNGSFEILAGEILAGKFRRDFGRRNFGRKETRAGAASNQRWMNSEKICTGRVMRP